MDLRGQKIKDTYGNVITIGSTAGAPSSGELTNGQNTPFTGLFTGGNFGVGSLPQSNATRSVLRIGKSGGNDGGLINFYDGTDSLGSIYTDSTGSLFINADPETVTSNSSIRFSVDGAAPALAIDSNQRIGVGTTSPTQALHVTGSARIQGAIYDSSNSAGTSGQLLSSTGTGTAWTSGGYVTSIGLTAPTGFTVANSPITSSGALALSFASGYSLPTNSSQTNWTTAYNNMITAASFSTGTGVVTLTQQDAGTVTVDIDGRYILESEKGANSGVATLDASGKIPSYQLPTSVFVYKGLWNASTNTPTLSNATGSVGEVYKCNVAGTVNFGAGNITFAVNDLALYDGSVWQKSDSTDDVLSVNSQTGVVVLTTSDINEGTNQYFTTARARASVSAGDGMSYSSSTGVIANADKGSSQNIFKSVAVAGEDTITADANDDTLTFVAGSGVTLATDASTDAITISATGTGGTLTSVDMTVPTGFTVSGNPITTSGTLAVSFDTGYALPTTASQASWSTAYNRSPTALAYNTSNGIITLTKEDATTLTATVTLAPFTTSTLTEGTNLYFTDSRARSAISAGTGISYSSATGVITNSSPDQTVVLTSGAGISTSGTYPSFTITNSDRGSSQSIFKNVAVSGYSTIVADGNDDTLTVASGAGISLSTNSTTDTLTITNSAPDQTVVLTAGTGISTSGTYPNFTITNSAPDQTVSIAASTGMSVTGTYPSFVVENTDRGSSQSIFKNIAVLGQSAVVADSNNDTLTLVAGNNITITTNAATDTITIDSPDAGGTVTSVAATGGTGISVSGSPITTSGTLTISSTATLSDVTTQGSSTSVAVSLNGGIYYSGSTSMKKAFISVTSGTGTQKYKIYDNQSSVDGYANIKIYRAFDYGDGATESATQDVIFSRRNSAAQYRYRAEGDASTVSEAYIEFYLQTDGHIEAWLVAEDYAIPAIEIVYSNGAHVSSPTSGTPTGTLEFTTDPDTTVPNQDFWVGKMFVNSAAATTDTDKFLVQDGNEVKYRTGAQVRSDIGAGTGDGSVTSVAMTVPTGFSISGSPITTSGTLALGFSAGYSLPSTSSQTNWNTAYNDSITAFAYNTSNGILTLTQQDAGTLTATVTLAPFTTANLTEGSNLYFTNARARSAISLTTTGTSGAATYNSTTGVLNIPQYQGALTNPVTGTGTTNYVTKWTSSSAVGNSSIFDNGSVGIGTTSPNTKLHVADSTTGVIMRIQNSSAGAESSLRFQALSSTSTQEYADIALDPQAGDGALVFRNPYTSERMRIDGSGNVGIGTTSPAGKLHLEGNFETSKALIIKGTLGTGTEHYFRTHGANSEQIAIYSGGVRAFNVSSSKVQTDLNVGIGTTSPDTKLHVVNGDVTGAFYDGSSVGVFESNNPYVQIIGTDSGNQASSLMLTTVPAAGTGNNKHWTLQHRGTSQSGNFGISYDTTSASGQDGADGTDKFVIDTSGNVGIGTTSPSFKLHVLGTSGGDSTFTSGILIDNNNATDGEPTLAFRVNSMVAGGNYWLTGLNQSADYRIAYGTSFTGPNTLFSIQADGNVGIGTTTPTSPLHIEGGTTSEVIKIEADADPYIRFVENGTNVGFLQFKGAEAYLSNEGNGTFFFRTNNTDKMVITAGGNVGIGYDSPYDLLHIHNSTSSGTPDAQMNFTTGVTGATDGNGLRVGWNGSVGNFYLFENADMRFATNNAERMRITSAGNVGIGTTSPSYKLEVSKTTADNGIAVVSGTSSLSYLNLGDSTVKSAGGIRYSNSDDTLYLRANSQNYLTLNSSGNVGIGTTTPTSKLHVVADNSTIATLESIGSNANSKTLIIQSGGDRVIFDAKEAVGGAAADLAFELGNSEVMRLSDTGNVGIGTTAPSHKLTINGGNLAVENGNIYLSSTKFLYFDYGVTNNYYIQKTSSTLKFVTAGNFVFDGGNVGIGTTSPSSKLHVNYEDAESVLTISRGGTDLSAGTAIGTIQFNADYQGSPISYGSIDMYANSLSGVRSSLDFNVKSTSGAIQTGLTVQGNSGTPRVGIGTTSPSQKLHVSGNAQIDYSLIGRGFRSSGRGELHLNATGSDDVSEMFFGYGSGYAENNIRWGISDRGATLGQLNFYRGPAFGSFATTLTLYSNLNASFYGNVGIGTTSPDAPLKVYKSSSSPTLLANFENPSGQAIIRISSKNDALAILELGDPEDGNVGAIQYDHLGNSMRFKTNDAERIRIDSSGNVGIGTTSPTAKLTVGANTVVQSTNGIALGIGQTSLEFVHATFQNGFGSKFYSVDSGSGVTSLRLAVRANSTTWADAMTVIAGSTNNGNVGIGTTSPAYKLDVNGEIRATGEVIAYSDARVKENVETIPNALEKVTAMRGVNYNKIGEQKRSTGVIAQELLEILPEAVHQDEEGMYSVAYGNVVGVLIEAIKEQQKQIDELKKMLG